MKKEIKKLTDQKIVELLKEFNKDKNREQRYASFDYCFNYFQSFKNKKDISSRDNIQNSCLQLGFYLASWGMYRGSTFLLQKSVKVYENLIKYISSEECDVWDIDVDKYEEFTYLKLIECFKRIKKELGVHGKNNKKATDTLVTKIMLGVFGNVPAFDNYFKKGSGLGVFNEKALKEIKAFYDTHKESIKEELKNNKTFNYVTGEKNKRFYTKAKLIDMIFFIKGLKENKKII